jgi:hypothetical protein
MSLKFPKRTDTHITETESWRILDSLAPRDWIVREVTERDYGIDAYIELVGENDEVTGKLVSAQLKGVDAIDWKKGKEGELKSAASPQIKTSTANYWHGLPVPVFLLVADLAARNVYFVPVKEHIRANFDKLLEQDTLTFPVLEIQSLRSPDGDELFKQYHARERLQPQFAFHMTNLISQMQTFAESIRENQNRDGFMEVEAERHLQFRALHESCRMASIYLDGKWPLETLVDLYKRDRDDFKDQWSFLHEQTLDHALQRIEPLFSSLVRKAIKRVCETEAAYWRTTDAAFHLLCCSSDLGARLTQFENEIGR